MNQQNLILNTDSYKLGHFLQYPDGVRAVSGYVTTRGHSYKPEVMFFGLQMFLKEYLGKPITTTDIDEAEEVATLNGQPFDRAGWVHILKVHGGYLPLRIEALPEGLAVRRDVPLVQISNTDPHLPWLTSYMETALLRAVWYPSTVTTMAWRLAPDDCAVPGADQRPGRRTHPRMISDFGGRSTDEVGELIRMNPDLEKEIYLISGQTYALGALPRILWVKNKLPELYQKVSKVGMFNDWLIYKLTGVLAVEPSNGSTTGIFDLQKRAWDASIMRKVGLKDDIFPPVAECGSVVGKVNIKGAADTGLAPGTTVVAGGGDSQLGCVGVGVVDNKQAAVFGGSFWQYEFNTDSGKADAKCRVRVNCHAVPGMWQYEALAFMPGLAMRWYRDAFCQDEIRRAKELGTDPYALMNKEAEKIPAGSHGMMCTFSDVMNFIAWKHAAPTFTNFDFDAAKFNKYTFYRAIMENAALVTKGHLELVREATGNAPEEIVFASGASKGDVWCQIVADVLGLPVKVPVVKEATALGAAILAGYGVGIYKGHFRNRPQAGEVGAHLSSQHGEPQGVRSDVRALARSISSSACPERPWPDSLYVGRARTVKMEGNDYVYYPRERPRVSLRRQRPQVSDERSAHELCHRAVPGRAGFQGALS